MTIDRITVTYGELKSKDFDHKKYRIELSALLDNRDNRDEVKMVLFNQARHEIKKQIEVDTLPEPEEENLPF